MSRIISGAQSKVYLGNLDARRDWGHAKDYVRAMWLMMHQDAPRDFVVGTGESHSVRRFCELAFEHVGLPWEPFVEIDPRYYRPTEVHELRADPTRAFEELGWRPTVTFPELVRSMVEHDLAEEGYSLGEARDVAPSRVP